MKTREELLQEKRDWRLRNLERERARDRRRYAEDPEKRRAVVYRWRAKNPTHYQAWAEGNAPLRRERVRRRYKTDPETRLRVLLRNRMKDALSRGWKSARTLELLGCTVPELRAHLEKQFRPGMTWENYGPVWHVDHRRPCASFDLTDPAQQRICFHYTNLQPLFAKENLKKGDFYAHD